MWNEPRLCAVLSLEEEMWGRWRAGRTERRWQEENGRERRAPSNQCRATVVTLLPLVTVLLSGLVCNTAAISSNDLSCCYAPARHK